MNNGMKPLNGQELQAARKAAAERFFAIGMSYLPDGWTVQYRKSLSGRAWYMRDGKVVKEIAAPKPVTRKSLYIFLHECAHAHLHYPIYERSRSQYRKMPKHVIEHEAEVWAHEKMREHGIAVPRPMTKRAKQYVARKIRQASNRGAKRIDAAARRFSKIT
jgi:hypothetical protein